MDQEAVDEHLRDAYELFKVFDKPKINQEQFKEGTLVDFNAYLPNQSNIVLEALGANVETEEELEEYFWPIDSDGVSCASSCLY